MNTPRRFPKYASKLMLAGAFICFIIAAHGIETLGWVGAAFFAGSGLLEEPT